MTNSDYEREASLDAAPGDFDPLCRCGQRANEFPVVRHS